MESGAAMPQPSVQTNGRRKHKNPQNFSCFFLWLVSDRLQAADPLKILRFMALIALLMINGRCSLREHNVLIAERSTTNKEVRRSSGRPMIDGLIFGQTLITTNHCFHRKAICADCRNWRCARFRPTRMSSRERVQAESQFLAHCQSE
jgi:hypothetical protein